MSVRSCLWWAMGLMVGVACEPRHPPASERSTTAARVVAVETPPPPSTDGHGLASPEALVRCREDLERVLHEAARFPSAHRRVQALLLGISTACMEVLPSGLREGAGDAAALRGVDRSRRLIEAARPFVPEECLAAPEAMAHSVESRCPPPAEHLASPVPGTLDTGSYVYALALRAQLRERGAYDERWAHRLIAEFLLRSALEGEARGAR